MRTIRSLFSLAVLAGLLVVAAPARAATITVNTTDDELNTDGDCSLREAIRSANSDGADPHDACTAGSGADTINVPAGTITLSVGLAGDDAAAEGDLDITSDVTIVGAGARQSFIDGADLDRVFHVVSGTAGISGLTIRNGMEANGAGVLNAGTLTMSNVAVTDHESSFDAAGVFNDGGTLTLAQSLLAANVSGSAGGGMATSGGSATIVNSTVSGNRAECMGGGIGVFNNTTLSMNNVTIANNDAHSPPAGPDGTCNGGGVFVDGTSTATSSNTLIGDNRDQSTGGDPNHPDCSGTIQSNSYDLIESTTGCVISGSATGNITGQDPMLNTLADRGGPTDTHQLKKQSPAVDAGNPATADGTGSACEPVDQRGTKRPRGPRCDIGAFERGAGQQLRCFNKKVTLMGSEGPDTLIGTAKRDVVLALGGDDIIVTGAGNDLVCSGAGNDKIRTQVGADQVRADVGNDKVRGGGGTDTLIGNAGRDRLRGQAKADTLRGGKGRDRLNGGGGTDRCRGGPGKDRVRRCET